MIDGKMLDNLKSEVSSLLSERRFRHTLAVEKAAKFLAEHCLPGKLYEVSAAAILHDVTKEFGTEEQERIVLENSLDVDISDKSFPMIAHSYTAPIIVKEKFPQFATKEILSSIANHTLGAENMTVFDKIIFLADFIEETRTYQDCLYTAKFVFESMTDFDIDKNISVLNTACIMEIDSTIRSLNERKIPVNKRTLLTRASLVSKN